MTAEPSSDGVLDENLLQFEGLLPIIKHGLGPNLLGDDDVSLRNHDRKVIVWNAVS